MPTVRGVGAALVGVALMVLGRAFGADGLLEVGFGLVVLVAAAVIVIRFGRHELDVTRTITPSRANAEQRVQVNLEVRNAGGGRAPVLMLEDRVPPELGGRARFTLMGLEPGGTRTIAYELRPPRRGRYPVGPLRVAFTDPFGLARLHEDHEGTDELLVHPRVDLLQTPRDIGQYRSPAVAVLRQLTGARGDDFYTLREYVNGDDLRKIHWPSTAKRDRYMIRQEETPWHTRATILLDDVAGDHKGAGSRSTFERAVEACASLASLYSRSGYSFRLERAAGEGVASARGGDHYLACLDLLATVEPVPAPQEALTARLSALQAGGSAEGSLVAVLGRADYEVAAALGACRRRYKDVFTVLFLGAGDTGEVVRADIEAVVTTLARSGVRPLVIGPAETLRGAWSAMSHRYRQPEAGWEQRQERV